MSVKVLKTNDTWYGMTYHEDVVAVKNSFKKILPDGMYKADLFSDLSTTMKETIDLLGKILTNILTALYEPFGFSLLLSFLAMFFYLYVSRTSRKTVSSSHLLGETLGQIFSTQQSQWRDLGSRKHENQQETD